MLLLPTFTTHQSIKNIWYRIWQGILQWSEIIVGTIIATSHFFSFSFIILLFHTDMFTDYVTFLNKDYLDYLYTTMYRHFMVH